jgi:hypothetical protein
VLKRENAGLVDTVDSLQRQLRTLQKTLKATTDLVKQKDIEIETLKKSNQEGLTKNDNNFYFGQASMLSELVRSGQIYIEPKGRHLVESLDGYLKGEYPSADSFLRIKSGLLSYCPPLFLLLKTPIWNILANPLCPSMYRGFARLFCRFLIVFIIINRRLSKI